MNLGDIAEKLYNNKKYQEIFELSESNHAEDLDLLFYVGLSLQSTGKIDEALSTWRLILARDALHEKAMRSMAWCSKEPRDRLFYLEKLARLEYADSEDLCFMAGMYLCDNRYQDAHHWYQKSISLDHNNSLATLGLADLHARLSVYYLQETEDMKDLDLNEQLSDSNNAEEVLRYMYDYIIVKDIPTNIP